MFDRYNITNADDRKRGVMSRFGSEGHSNGTVLVEVQEVV
jgi:hypothetical protein